MRLYRSALAATTADNAARLCGSGACRPVRSDRLAAVAAAGAAADAATTTTNATATATGVAIACMDGAAAHSAARALQHRLQISGKRLPCGGWR